jgi:hypothetical protein
MKANSNILSNSIVMLAGWFNYDPVEKPLTKEARSFTFYHLLGLLILAVYAVLALVYARERLYGDSAIYLHWLVQNETFQILHLRPSSFFTQWLPLIGIKAGADLQHIILLHSFSDWPILALCWTIIAFTLRQPALALAMLLSLLIGSRWNYFNPVSELLTGLPFFFLMFGVLLRFGESKRTLLLAFPLLIFTLFNHKLYTLLIPMCLIWLYLVRLISTKTLSVSLLLTIVGAGIQWLAMDDYDSASMEGRAQEASILSRFNTFPFKEFFKAGIKDFAGEWSLILLMTAGLIYKRSYLAAAYLVGSVTVFTGLIIYKFGDLYPNTYEPFERYLFPLAAFIAFAFFTYLPIVTIRTKSVLIAFIALYHFVILTHYGHVVTKRYNQFELAINYAAANNIPKLSFRSENYYIEPLGHNWTMVNESVLLSAASNKGNVSQIFIHEYFSQQELDSVRPNQLFCYPAVWCRTFVSDLNPNYFRMKEGAIQMANTDSIQLNRGEAWFKRLQVSFGKRIGNYPGSYTYIPITITNPNTEPLTSGKRLESIWIYTSWTDSKGEKRHHCESPVFADVHQQLTQYVRMKNATTGEDVESMQVGIYLSDSLLIPIASIDKVTLENNH